MSGFSWRYDRPGDGKLWPGAWTPGTKWAHGYVEGPTCSAGHKVKCIECSRETAARAYADTEGNPVGALFWPVKHSNPATGKACEGAGFYGEPEWLAEYDREVQAMEQQGGEA